LSRNVGNYQATLRKIPQHRRSHLRRDESLKLPGTTGRTATASTALNYNGEPTQSLKMATFLWDYFTGGGKI
jgi:hypothetical protein